MEDQALDLLDDYQKDKTVSLKTIQGHAVELRDYYLKKADLEQQLEQIKNKIQKIERDELPEMFTKAGVSSVTVEPTGNHPAFVAERKTAYNASIPEDKRQDAFQWLEDNGHGDLVKSVIDITFGMQEHEKRLAVMKLLSDAGIQFYNHESIHHMTLKAFVKREITAGRMIPMDLLGVFVFDEVKIK